MLAGRSTLIGWTRKIIVTLAVTHAYGLPAAALPQVPYPMEVGQTGLSGLSLSSTRPSPLHAQGEATGRNVRPRIENGQPLGVGPQMPGIMASSLETVAEGPPEGDSLDSFLDAMQMPEIIGTLLSEQGSLKAPITMVIMADGSGKTGAMNQDVLSEVIDEFAKKEAFLTYLENDAGASFKVAAHLTIDEAGAASLYDVAGGGRAYKGIKVYTMAEAAGIPAYAARMEGVVVLFFTQTPSGLDVSNPEHLKLFGEMVTHETPTQTRALGCCHSPDAEAVASTHPG